MDRDRELSLFEKILLATDGTVTDLISLYAGEPIRVQKLEQILYEGHSPPELACLTPVRLLLRRILLSGATRNYLYAESHFVVERLPRSICDQMLDSDRSIGLLWKEARLETFREIVSQSIEPCAPIAPHFDVPATEPFVSRTYVVHHLSKPLGMITEKWPLHSFHRRTDTSVDQLVRVEPPTKP